jgi:hypothetical protein
MKLNPVFLFVIIVLLVSGYVIYKYLPNSPWYPDIVPWVWVGYILISIVALFGSYVMSSAMG